MSCHMSNKPTCKVSFYFILAFSTDFIFLENRIFRQHVYCLFEAINRELLLKRKKYRISLSNRLCWKSNVLLFNSSNAQHHKIEKQEKNITEDQRNHLKETSFHLTNY